MVLSDGLAYSEIYGVLKTASEQLGRTENPTVSNGTEWSNRARSGNAFVGCVIAPPKR